jgi:hypothetical protein
MIDLLFRAYAFGVGLLLAGHFFSMINADKGGKHPYSPPLLIALCLSCVAAGIYLAATAVLDKNFSPEASLVIGPLLAFVMWLWTNGFHVCDFVEKKWGRNRESKSRLSR